MADQLVSSTIARLLAATLVPALVLTACTSGSGDSAATAGDTATTSPESAPADPTPADPPPTTPTPVTADPTPEADVETAQDDTPARRQLAWVIDALDPSTGLTVADVETRFAPSFLAVVSPDEVIAAAADIVAMATPPFELVSVDDEQPDGLALAATIRGTDAETLVVLLEVEPDEPHRIAGLQLLPGEVPELPETTTIDEIDATLTSLGASSALGVYDVTDGACDVLHERRADEVVVLGSTFKLWILAELARQIQVGDAAWDEPLAVVDAHRSSPDGEIFAEPTGTERTLREYAELMIAISDNSATDHLLARLGRENVEATVARIGVAPHPGNVPMLSTGALFELKFIARAPNSSDWRAADEAGRRAILADLDAAVLPWVADGAAVDTVNADGVRIDEPRDLDIEWFATPRELCATMVHLAELAEQPGLEPIADILEAGRGGGIPFDPRWTSVRFKGGSEPGVVAGAFWFERDDGRRIVIAGGVSDPERAVDELTAAYAIASAIVLVND